MKIVDAVLVIISIIALLGSVIAGYAIMQVGSSLQMLGANSGLGEIPGLQNSINLFNTLLLFGWVWVIAVIISSLYAIRIGVERIRKKKK